LAFLVKNCGRIFTFIKLWRKLPLMTKQDADLIFLAEGDLLFGKGKMLGFADFLRNPLPHAVYIAETRFRKFPDFLCRTSFRNKSAKDVVADQRTVPKRNGIQRFLGKHGYFYSNLSKNKITSYGFRLNVPRHCPFSCGMATH